MHRLRFEYNTSLCPLAPPVKFPELTSCDPKQKLPSTIHFNLPLSITISPKSAARQLPSKLRIFLWKCVNKILPTANFLNVRDLNFQDICPFCRTYSIAKDWWTITMAHHNRVPPLDSDQENWIFSTLDSKVWTSTQQLPWYLVFSFAL